MTAKKRNVDYGGGSDINYELEYLRNENEKLRSELEKKSGKMSKSFENDVNHLLQVSMKMRKMLEICRQQTLPFEIGKQIDMVLKELDNY